MSHVPCLTALKFRFRMVRAVEKLHKAITSLEDFTTRQWQFKCNNVLALSKELQGSDKETFAFDIRQLHWPTYWEDYVLGMRKFILKEDHSSLPVARKKLNRLYYRDSVVFFGVLLAVCHLFARRSQLASRMWFFLATLAVRIYSALNKARWTNSSSWLRHRTRMTVLPPVKMLASISRISIFHHYIHEVTYSAILARFLWSSEDSTRLDTLFYMSMIFWSLDHHWDRGAIKVWGWTHGLCVFTSLAYHSLIPSKHPRLKGIINSNDTTAPSICH